eukprot:gnl/TRDRNA2_/TRDRNA2_169641_c1_seq1.p1 gnl/TRDRNA2_/TRDRNA2_169641_c1~~gnl/TRDRNA2_/TRDRNA2_169641_c1_seq1.p1  ORF type:complete len:262 (-),score=29.22 gnl/TRDRNA2_/TRDRNA2_169641_c1_seq1:135-920(-)
MSIVEQKVPRYYTRVISDKESFEADFDTDVMVLNEKQASVVIGKGGAKRKMLSAASNAVLQIVGQHAFIAGDLDERSRCRDYIGWLLDRNELHCRGAGAELTLDVDGRTDVIEMHLHGTGSLSLDDMSWIESESQTFTLTACNSLGENRLLIFGHDHGSWDDGEQGTGRCKAAVLAKNMLQEHRQQDRRRRSRSRSPALQSTDSKWQHQGTWRQKSAANSFGVKAPDSAFKADDAWRNSSRGQTKDDVIRRSPTPPWRKKR